MNLKPKTCDVTGCRKHANPANKIKTTFNTYTYCNNCWPQIQTDISRRPNPMAQQEWILKETKKRKWK